MMATENTNRSLWINFKKCFDNVNHTCAFFVLFAMVLLVESISATYIISTTQAIERQFQVPSKLSGVMVSASDFAYIPMVIFVSYFGSKGNRVKWIGIGTLTTAFSHLLISSSNFLFPVEQQMLNYSSFHEDLLPSNELLTSNARFSQFFDYKLIKDRVNETLREEFLKKILLMNDNSFDIMPSRGVDYSLKTNKTMNMADQYTLNERLLSEIVQKMQTVVGSNTNISIIREVRNLLQQYVNERANELVHDLDNIKNSARAPFAFCSKSINNMRDIINTSKCDKKFFQLRPIIILFLGLIGFGVGRCMPWSLGVPIIDDSFSKKNLPTFFAGMNFIRILGPVCGFLIGSLCSSLYYTLKPPPGLTARDPTWIGAWWLGYLFIGLLLVGPSSGLYLLSIRNKSTKVPQISLDAVGDSSAAEEKRKKMSVFDKQSNADTVETTIYGKFQALFKAYREILHSKIFIGLLTSRTLDLLAFRGYMVFLPKYLEMEFGIPQYNVHIIMAIFGIFGLAMGAVSGGLIVRRHKFNGRTAAIFILILTFINISLFFCEAFIGCYSTISIIGANGWSKNYNYTQPCNADCHCQSAPLYPVCDKFGQAFFSPCHAGCRDVTIIDATKHELEFSSCECKPEEVLSRKNCQDGCTSKALIFIAIIIIGSFAIGNCLVPGILLLLRSVPPEHRSIALGLQGFVISLFASLPSPFIWGTIVDTACLVWSYTCPGIKGACAIYQPVLLRQRLHFTYVGFRCASAIFDIYVVKQARGVSFINETDDNNKRPTNVSEVTGKTMQSTPC